MNKPLATRPIMRAVFAEIGVPSDISNALMDAARHARKQHPEQETMAQMFVSVAQDLGIESLKTVVAHPFKHAYLKNQHRYWTGIKAAKARKLLRNWSAS